MNIYDYIKTYNYTFEEKEFNEVDNVILSTIIYTSFDSILKDSKKRLEDVWNEYLKEKELTNKKEIIPTKVAVKLLEYASKSVRYKDILMYNYEYVGNETCQFSAVTFESNSFIYVAYEGTDALISGWEEDFKMSYMFPVDAHKKAIKYLGKYTFSKKDIYVGGHSKGGNLALVASMYSNFILYSKIKMVYSNDGQGVRTKEFLSSKYKKVCRKLVHIMPKNSIVGVMFRRNEGNDIVVKTNALPIFSHDPSTWRVDNDKFIRVDITKNSRALDLAIDKWFQGYAYKEREEFISDIFNILKDNNITTLYQIMENPPSHIINIIKSSSKLPNKTKGMFNELINVFNESRKEL